MMKHKSKNQAVFRKGKKKGPSISREQKEEIKEAFQLYFHWIVPVALRALGFEIPKSELISIAKEYDPKQTGRIEFIDFEEIVKRKILTRDPNEEMNKAFELFDDDGTGKITLRNLRRVARELGEKLSDTELQAMIDEFDTDQDGEISRDDFFSIMKQTSIF